MASGTDNAGVNDSRDGGIVDGDSDGANGNLAPDNGAADPAAGIAPKRGRGRPRKSDTGTLNGNAERNARSTGTPKAAQLDLDSLAMQLIAGHAIAAKLMKAPELMIGQDEAKSLAKAIKQILAQYPVNISPKAMAFYQLMAAASVIYVPRMVGIAARKAKEASAKKQAQNMMPVITPQGNGVPGAFDNPPPPTGNMKYN